MTHTFPYRRQETLDATTSLSVSQMIEDLPVLKKWNYVSILLHCMVRMCMVAESYAF